MASERMCFHDMAIARSRPNENAVHRSAGAVRAASIRAVTVFRSSPRWSLLPDPTVAEYESPQTSAEENYLIYQTHC